MSLIALPLLFLSLIGTLYTAFAALSVARFARLPRPAPVPAEPVTLLKPLHGAEPFLAANLASFLRQDWNAPVQMIAGVQRTDDPARPIAEAAGATMIVDGTRHGANAKVSNLINMAPAASHDLILLSDSDMRVTPDYLATVAATLAQPGVGAVTCAYRGAGDAGFWSVLGAAGISYHFLPSVIVGTRLGLADPCMGSTIAIRRATLDAIGGFDALRDVLADDYQIGVGVRALGRRVAIPPLLVTHGCDETSLAQLIAHETRWAVTIRDIDPTGHRGQIATFPIPFALLALPFAATPALFALAAGVIARFALVSQVDRLAAAKSAPKRWLLLRDCLSFYVFVLSFFARSVEWRGATLKMADDGRIASEPEIRPR